MRRRLRFLALVVCACGQGLDAQDVEHSIAELSTSNGLDFNGLGANGLNSNGLNSNGLNSNGLNSNGLNSNGLNSNGLNSNGLAFAAWYNSNPTLNAQVIKYLAKCAMPSGSSLSYAGVTYPGVFGLAPGWATRAPTLDEQRWVSACMLAHVNSKGQSVVVSFRAPGKIARDQAEAAFYSNPEGAFWGNLFSPSVSKSVCSNMPTASFAGTTIAQAQTDLGGRMCTVSGNTMCGMTVYGACGGPSAGCISGADSLAGFTSCQGITQVISTYVPLYCGDNRCSSKETRVSCPVDCGVSITPLPSPL